MKAQVYREGTSVTHDAISTNRKHAFRDEL